MTRTIHIISTSDPTVEMALVNHKKLIIEDEENMEKQDKSADLAKKSLHDLSQVKRVPIVDEFIIYSLGYF